MIKLPGLLPKNFNEGKKKKDRTAAELLFFESAKTNKIKDSARNCFQKANKNSRSH
jgi:hypothetical protein